MAVVAACGLDKQNAPALTGPSEFGVSINTAVSPDMVPQDGRSRSVITITARDANSQPIPGLTLRVETAVNGTLVDFGTLSSRSVSTGSDGRATVSYTAPPEPPANVDADTIVDIVVTPVGSDFNNSRPTFASIRLTPPSTVVGPNGAPVAKLFFSPTAPKEGENIVFDGSQSTDDGTIVSYSWSFGDGRTASGKQVNHSYDLAGAYNVVLTVTDDRGLSNSTAPVEIAVGVGAVPTANFSFSPSTVKAGQNVFFNGSLSTALNGREIVAWDWDFGDGATGSGVTIAHIFGNPGTYNVVLKVTDSAGKVGTVTKSVTITAAPEHD
jgi:PKD repeat protein